MRGEVLRLCFPMRLCLSLPFAAAPYRALSGWQAASGQAARKITENARKSLASLKREHPRLEPTLAIIQAHNAPLVQEMNKNFAEEVGLRVINVCLPEDSSKDEIVNEILRLNEDPNVQGLALDLPESLCSSKILNAVKPEKDVDGLSDINLGRLVRGEDSDYFVSPTAGAVMELLEDLDGKTVLLVGINGALGSSLQCLLQRRGAITASCLWKSPGLQSKLHHADVVVAGSPKPDSVPKSWLKPGTTIINCSPDLLSEKHSYDQKNSNTTENAVCSLAVAMRMQNMVKNTERWIQSQQLRKWDLHCLKLQPLSPVPSDIEISRAQSPKAVDVLAKEIGLLTDEIEIYGQTKAKVRLSLLERLKDQPDGKYVLVAGITPTPLGEGKSTVTIGLVQALTAHLKINSFACLRQPSQGPTFGVKGGAAGGGYAQVIPMEEVFPHNFVGQTLHQRILCLIWFCVFSCDLQKAVMKSESQQASSSLGNLAKICTSDPGQIHAAGRKLI
ncbi:monofunctional C1-tetrahydrofolate synthase, mitochondrial isoform X2 [Gallus gallus]|uniref:monofunctional C1-tetrahydrofolate synthase, mitochondrial isoform X2 n=1 Tax=Gallus gallus TaxID=9031 RepID=UPI001AE69559|nr:monofunctional C1-tetrahydrofolate synthase, mitochondrial isoform X2 [Gallus gallus]